MAEVPHNSIAELKSVTAKDWVQQSVQWFDDAIGMKRAIFKMGSHFEIVSQTKTEGWSMSVDVQEWAKKDKGPDDWMLPLAYLPAARTSSEAGTSIKVSSFSDEVAHAFNDKMLIDRLYKAVAKTYALFLNRFVRVVIQGKPVAPMPIPVGESDKVEPSVEAFEDHGVNVRIVANFAAKGDAGAWQSETAGWYVLCNGRIVVAADKSELTGWGAGILATYQPKFRGFVGMVSFDSDDPLKLPWTTTKRGLNRDALVYQRVRTRMATVATPIIRQLERFYGPEKETSIAEREVADSMRQADLTELSNSKSSAFKVKVKPKSARKKITEQVNFSAKISDLEKVRRHLRSPKMSKSAIGEYVFQYFLKSEGL